MTDKKKTTLLLILDGWGYADDSYPVEKNGIKMAKTPFWDALLEKWPNTLIGSSGNAVGLPDGIMGNSEVGHLNLGAGRVVWQEIARIDNEIIKDGLKGRPEFVAAIEKARDTDKCIHLMGLVSDGGVHSMDRHYLALLRLAKNLGLPAERVKFHCLLDGRDTPPRSGKAYVANLETTMQEENLGRIATVTGRYWGMDRDKRWDRVKKAYDAMISSKAEQSAKSGVEAVENAYARDENDEFVEPTIIQTEDGTPVGGVESGDQIIFFNFRPDRARQICHAFSADTFDGFERVEDLKIDLTTMTQYEGNMKAAVAFPPTNILDTLGEVVSKAGKKQLRIAETEKYAHVTYFFSGGQEAEFDGEDRILVPSPKVATYDLQPEMSLPEVSKRLAEAIRSGKYDLIVSNFANGDMVGHTGFLKAVVTAAEAVDKALSIVIPAIQEVGGNALITADHGNAENTWNFEVGCPHTQHTTTPTPCVIVGAGLEGVALRETGALGDVAPTILDMMDNMEQPKAMTSKSLFKMANDSEPIIRKVMMNVTYVNDMKVEEAHIQEEMNRLRPDYQQMFYEQPHEEQEEQLHKWAEENLVERALLFHAAKNDPEAIPADEIEKKYAELLEEHGGKEKFYEYFEMTEEREPDVKMDIENRMRYERQLDRIQSSVPEVTDADIQKYYDENTERFTSPEMMRASHIVKHLGPDEQSEEIVEEMAKILKGIRNNGNFEEIAAEMSDCPDSAGDLGLFPRGQMVQNFEDTVFKMEVGEISEVFRTEFGYHIAKVTEKHPEKIAPFEEIKEQAKEELEQLTRQQAVETFVDAQREKATIEVREEEVEIVE